MRQCKTAIRVGQQALWTMRFFQLAVRVFNVTERSLSSNPQLFLASECRGARILNLNGISRSDGVYLVIP
jgi:hypothetical protein